jgi:hypothetical protein
MNAPPMPMLFYSGSSGGSCDRPATSLEHGLPGLAQDSKGRACRVMSRRSARLAMRGRRYVTNGRVPGRSLAHVVHPFSCVGIPGFSRGGKRISGLL